LITVNPYGPLFAQWIIRDQFITLKVNLVYGDYILRNQDKGQGQLFDTEIVKFPLDLATLEKDSAISTASVAYFTRLAGGSDYAFANATGDGNGNGDGEKYFELIIQEIHQTHLTTEEINANRNTPIPMSTIRSAIPLTIMATTSGNYMMLPAE